MIAQGRIFPVELLDFYINFVAFDLSMEAKEATEATLDVLVEVAPVGRA